MTKFQLPWEHCDFYDFLEFLGLENDSAQFVWGCALTDKLEIHGRKLLENGWSNWHVVKPGMMPERFDPYPDFNRGECTVSDFIGNGELEIRIMRDEAERFKENYFGCVTSDTETAKPVSAPLTTGGAIKKGKSYTPQGRFMDHLLEDYRAKYKKESDDFNLLLTFVVKGMKSVGCKYGYEVLAVDRDKVTLKIKRKQKEIRMGDLEKLWNERKIKNPYTQA